MKRTTLFLLAITFSTFAFAESGYFKMSYHGYNFYLPEAPKASGFLGSENDTIILKYGEDPGEGLVGFSVESEMATDGCDPEEFFKEVLGKPRRVVTGWQSSHFSMFLLKIETSEFGRVKIITFIISLAIPRPQYSLQPEIPIKRF